MPGISKQKSSDNILKKKQEFEAIAFVHMNALYNTALRMTRNELDAEDLVQDVYVRAFRFFHKFERGTNFKAWIFKILTNTYINQYRKKIKQPQKVDFEKIKHSFTEKPSRNGKFDKVLNQEEGGFYEELFDDEIQEALFQLSDEFRMVVLLADVEGFSYKEIAQIMECPIGTVMSRLSRARKQLQNILKDYATRHGFINKSIDDNNSKN